METVCPGVWTVIQGSGTHSLGQVMPQIARRSCSLSVERKDKYPIKICMHVLRIRVNQICIKPSLSPQGVAESPQDSPEPPAPIMQIQTPLSAFRHILFVWTSTALIQSPWPRKPDIHG
jgi:hypothetical protein